MTTAVKAGRLKADGEGAVRVGRARRPKRRYFALNGATLMTIAALTLSAIGILYLMQTSQVAGLGYQLAFLQQRHDELALENSRLSYQVARHEALEMVEQVAIQRLGMTELRSYRFIEVRRPAVDDLPPPRPETPPRPSFWQRVVGAVMGVGWAESDTARPSAPASPAIGEEAP